MKKYKDLLIERKLITNKKNNQLFLALSRKELGLKKKQNPKKIKFKIEDFDF